MEVYTGSPHKRMIRGENLGRTVRNVALAVLWVFTLYQGGSVVLHEAREHNAVLTDITLGRPVSVWDASRLSLESWSDDPVQFRWALGQHASLVFRQHASFRAGQVCDLEFGLVDDFAPQTVNVFLNQIALTGFRSKAGGIYRSAFPCQLLQPGTNTVELHMPDAATPHSVDPTSADNRLLGVGLRTFTVTTERTNSNAR